MKIALISCSKNKMTIDCVAQEMYSKSTLFNKTFQYCLRQNYDFIFILSAKYGILHPDDKISPYELTLNSFSKCERKTWAAECFKTLLDAGQTESQFDFYAGKIYSDELSKLLPYTANILKGLGIGERLKFLKL
jgi:hypothetical protein